MGIEQSLIGGLLNAPERLAEVYALLKPEDFQDQKCGKVYGAMLEIVRLGENPDLVMTARTLQGQVDLAWLAGLTDTACFPSGIVRDASLIAGASISKRIKAKALALAKSNMDVQELAESLLAIAGEAIGRDSKSWKMSDAVKRFTETVSFNSRNQYGMSTGYEFMDDKYIKYMPGHVWVIGAKTSAGKTATVVDMICRLIENHPEARAAIVSTEMMEEQNIARLIARMTGYHSHRILNGTIEDGYQDVARTLQFLSESDVYLFDDLYHFQDVEMRLRQISVAKKLDVVFVDYVQNMQWRGVGSEYEKTNAIAKGFQRLAKQLKCCFVLLSQVSNSTARGDHDNLEFKGGGELAAVADLGVMLRRYKAEKTHLAFNIEKNRHGQTGTQVLQFVNHFTRLKEVFHADNC